MKNNHKFLIRETISLQENIKIETFGQRLKKFLTQTIIGWFPSKRLDLSPDGVQKERIIDRKKDYYKEYIEDKRTGRIIRDVEERLTDHKK